MRPQFAASAIGGDHILPAHRAPHAQGSASSLQEALARALPPRLRHPTPTKASSGLICNAVPRCRAPPLPLLRPTAAAAALPPLPLPCPAPAARCSCLAPRCRCCAPLPLPNCCAPALPRCCAPWPLPCPAAVPCGHVALLCPTVMPCRLRRGCSRLYFWQLFSAPFPMLPSNSI